jgi:hypothetical protein
MAFLWSTVTFGFTEEHLTGREWGRECHEMLAGGLVEDQDQSVSQLDLGRTGVAVYSFPDKMLGKLIPRNLANEFGPKYVALTCFQGGFDLA